MKDFQDLSLGDYLHVLRRRIWYFIFTTILAAAGAAAYIWHMPSIYKSETTVVVADRLLPEDYIGSIVRDSVSSKIDFVRQQLQSRTFLERIVQEFQMGGTDRGGLDNAITNVLSNIEITVFSTNTLRLAYYATDPNLAHAITRRLAETVILLNQSFRKERVQVADQFLDEQMRRAEAELVEAELKLQTFQRQHFAGVPTDQAQSLNTLTGLQAQLMVGQSQLDDARDTQRSIQRRLEEHRRLKVVMNSPAPAPLVRDTTSPDELALQQRLAAKRAELETIQAKYTPEHPDVIRVARETQELEARLASLPPKASNDTQPGHKVDRQNEVAAADFEEAEIQIELDRVNRDIAKRQGSMNDTNKKIQTLQARLNPSTEISQELTVLVRNHEAAKQRYSYLASRKSDAQLAASVDTNERNETFKVLDEASLPTDPVRPNRPLLALVSIVASMFLGVGIAFTREYFDPSISNEEQASSELKLPVLSSIPEFTLRRQDRRVARGLREVRLDTGDGRFDLNRADAGLRKMLIDPLTPAGEQFRIMRARLAAMQKERALKTILITSSVPGEGKTFVACSLAGILAREHDKRVLLIDGDLRTANARQVLGLSTETSGLGLVDILRHQTKRSSVERSILQCVDCNFYFLPAGEYADDAAELLSSPNLELLMRDLAMSFDWIIIDSTPILNVADANLMVSVCDGTLLVARAGKTPTKLIQNSIQRIGKNKMLGVLLNRVNRLGSPLSYTGYYAKYHRRAKAAIG